MKPVFILLMLSFLSYSCRNSRHEEASALYQAGIRYEQANFPDSAVLAYRSAAELLDGTGEYGLLGQVYNRLGDLLLVHEIYDRAWDAHEVALKYSSMLDDKSCESHAYRGLGKNFYLQKNIQGAIAYFSRALQLEDRVADREERSSVYNNLANAYSVAGEYQRALEYNSLAMRFTKDSVKIYRNCAVKGRLFTLLQQYDSAYYYLSIASRSSDPRIQASCFYKLSEMPFESGVTASMKYEYLNRANLLTDSIEDMSKAVQVTEKEHEQLLKQLESREKNRLVYVTGSLVVLGILAGSGLYYCYKRRIRLHREEVDRLFAEAEKTTERDQHNDSREKQMIAIIGHTGNTCLDEFVSSPFYSELKERLKSEEVSLNYAEQDELRKVLLREFDSYIRQITAIISLSPNDAYLCCLSLLGLSTKECAVCRGVSSETIRSQRTRIKKKIPVTFLENGFFQAIFREE